MNILQRKKDLKGILLFIGLVLAAISPAGATDYVITYTSGGTTYYLGMNGNNVAVKTTPDQSCIWTAMNGNNETSLSTNNSYALRNKQNTGRYLNVTVTRSGSMLNRTYTWASPSAATSASNIWRRNGSTVYARDNTYGRQAALRYQSNAWSMRDDNTAAENNTIFALTAVAASSVANTTWESDPVVSPASYTLEYGSGKNFTVAAEATVTTTDVPAHQAFTVTSTGTTWHYYNNAFHTDAQMVGFGTTTTSHDISYSWALSGDGASALTLSPGTGSSTTVNYTSSASGDEATLTVTATVDGESRTASATINVTLVAPTAIGAEGISVNVDAGGVVNYSLTPDYGYDRVKVTSSDESVFTVSSPATGGYVTITPVSAGIATLTLTALKPDGTDGPSKEVTITVRDRCATPVFSFSQEGNNVLVTITTATPGATIHYTTDGTEPTALSATYTGPFTITPGQTIKAIATNAEPWDPSEVVSKTIHAIDYVEQGVSGGTVTLNDLEDHTWTYYSGVSSDIDGGNYNTNYLRKLYSPNPRNVKITYNANGGAVSIDESETQFVYYKTLEESTTSGEYAYQVISNPFSKRPNGKGFGGWKIKEGADYIKGYADEATLPLDAEIVFNNLPYPEVNSISAEIELEATWVNLNNITYANNNTFTYNVSGGTYETNILVLNRDVTGTITTSSPVTIMMVAPDGSADYRNTYTFTGNITPNNNGVTKIEFASWNPSGTVDARGRNLTIGRGMTMGGTRRALVGTAQTSGMNQVLKVESGNFSTFTSYTANPSSVTRHWVVLGCDYDRAKNDNSKLTFTEKFLTGNERTLGLSATQEMARVWSKSGSFMTNVGVGNAAAENSYYLGVTGNHNNGHRYMEIEGGEWYANITGGMGENHTATVPAFTFRMSGGIVRGSLYGAAAWAMAGGLRTYVITGGTIRGWVAGGANGTQTNEGTTDGTTYIYVGGTAEVNSNGSTTLINRAIGGNVFGAGCGYSATSSSGQVTNGTNVVVADEAYVERGVYGGGSYGYTNATANLYILGGTVGGNSGGVNGTSYNADITGGVFGGACQNNGGTVNMYMNGGLVEGGIYGGSNANGTISGDVTMHIDGGQVGTSTSNANVHGGGYGSATRVLGNVEVNIGSGCDATDGATIYGDVYGGSAEGRTNGNNSHNGSSKTTVKLYEGTIYGGLYGGGLGTATNPAYVYGPVSVQVFGGSVLTNDGTGENGSGGVFGCNNVNGAPQGTVNVDIYGTDPAPDANSYALYAVYGGGNRSDYNGTPVVNIHGCDNSIEYVYGGGNASDVAGTNVTIWGGHIGNAFGGGNGFGASNPGANITTNGTRLTIHGGQIEAAFGGSNQKGYINETITVTVSDQDETGTDDCGRAFSTCPHDVIVELYGGGNQAPIKTSSDVYIVPGVSINTCDMEITNLFGGAKAADYGGDINFTVTKGKFQNVFGGNNQGGIITGNVTLTLKGGSMENAFGGCNQSGDITGTITVVVDSTGNDCPLEVDNVYGGGKDAPYEPSSPSGNTPIVNVLNGTVHNAVFGGGLGETATVKASPKVTIGSTGTKPAFVGGKKIDGEDGVGNVYGGGSAADVVKDGVNTGDTHVILQNKAVVRGNVYGGGNEADVEGDTKVELK